MLVSTIIIPFGAFLRKRFKIIQLFRVGIASFLIGTLLAIYAPNFTILLLGRLIQGIANGLLLPLMFSVIVSQAPKKNLGFFMGLGNLILVFAPTFGPIYGGFISKYFEWKFIFIFLLPIVLITYFLGEMYFKQDIVTSKIKFDIKGGSLLALTLLAGLLFINLVTADNISIFVKIILIVLTISLIAVFSKYEQRNKTPLLNLSVFKEPTFAKILFAFFLLQMSSLSMSYLIPNVLQMGLDQNISATGLLVAPAALINSIFAAVGGIIYDKLRYRIPIIGGTLWIFITFIIMAVFKANFILLPVCYASFMVGLGLTYGNIMTYSLSKLDSDMRDDGIQSL